MTEWDLSARAECKNIIDKETTTSYSSIIPNGIICAISLYIHFKTPVMNTSISICGA